MDTGSAGSDVVMTTDHFSMYLVMSKCVKDSGYGIANPVWESPSESNPFGGAAQFNIFSLGNVSDFPDVEGAIAVGGNMYFGNKVFSAGVVASNSSPTSGLPAHGPFQPVILFGGNEITGKIIQGPGNEVWVGDDGKGNLQTFKGHFDHFKKLDGSGDDNTLYKVAPIEKIKDFFESAKSDLEAMNTTLFQLPTNGTIDYLVTDKGTEDERENKRVLVFEGKDSSLNVFELKLSEYDFSQIDDILIQVEPNSNVLINVVGNGASAETVRFKPCTTEYPPEDYPNQSAGKTDPRYVSLAQHTVWNFAPNIATIQFQPHHMLMGSILAPKAILDIQGGSGVNGNVVVSSVQGNCYGWEGHYFPTEFEIKESEAVDNLVELVTVRVTKEWDPSAGGPVTVRLLKNGEQTDKRLTLSGSGATPWSGAWYGLPAGDEAGAPIEYSVVEDLMEGYLPEYDQPVTTTHADKAYWVEENRTTSKDQPITVNKYHDYIKRDGKLGTDYPQYITEEDANKLGGRSGEANGYHSRDITFCRITVRETTIAQNITNIAVAKPLPGVDPVENHKTIDYLGDGVENTDTTLRGDNEYRLNLDVISNVEFPASLVLVLDVSGSMKGGNLEALHDVLNGIDGKPGFIQQFLDADSRNEISIVTFSGSENGTGANTPYGASVWKGDAKIPRRWGTDRSEVSLTASGGTDYGAGLYYAEQQLNDAKDSNNKYMIFMSDGEPTYILSTYYNPYYSNHYYYQFGFANASNQPATSFDFSNRIYRYGNGSDSASCVYPNKSMAEAFASRHRYTTTFTIGLGLGASDTAPPALVALSGKDRYLPAKSGDYSSLESAFAKILGPQGVSIVDQLSDYVDFADQADIQLVARAEGSTTDTVLYQRGEMTPEGARILAEITTAEKKITAQFKEDFILTPGTKYTLSFNVTVSEQAHQEYEKGYPNTGDPNTDMEGNSTSAEKPGFYSNDSAGTKLVYRFGYDGARREAAYEKPVVQVNLPKTASLSIRKVDQSNTLLSGVEFELYRADASWNKVGAPIAYGTSDANGSLSFGEHGAGQYLLVETKTKPGYQLLTEPFRITISEEGGVTIQGLTAGADGVFTIVNHRLPTLPAVGGDGVAGYFAGGLALLSVAGWLMLRNRKNEHRGVVK